VGEKEMRIIKRACSAVLLLAFSFAPGAHGQIETESQQTRAAARTALHQHRYAEAINLLEEALKNSPNDQGLKIELAKAYLYDHQDGPAMQILKEVLGQDPSNRVAKLELARALGYHRDYEASNQLYRELLKAHPDEAAEVGLVRNLIRQRKTAEASRELKVALSQYPNSVQLQEYERHIESRNVPRPSAQVEPKHAIRESYGQVLGTVSFLSDSAGNRSVRSTQQFGYAFTEHFSNRIQIEERRLWQTATPKANALWADNELQFHPSHAVMISAGGGLARFADGGTRGLYRGGLQIHPTRSLWVNGGFMRAPIVPTFKAAQFDLIANEWNARLVWNPRGWRTYLYGMTQRYSDTNRAKRAGAELVRWVGSPRFSVGAGYQFRYISFSQRLFHGYFEPGDYKSHLGVAGIKYSLAKEFRAEYVARAGGEFISGIPFHTAWEVSLRHRVTLGHWDLGGDYSYFRLAQNTAAYNSQMGHFVVLYRF
jgi:tetratricopeptide (TPR) repeat protein